MLILFAIALFILIILTYVAFIEHYIADMNILVAVICIDRDADVAEKLYDALIKNNAKDILIVTRESDTKIIKFWENKSIIKTIPHYEIKNRHNFEKIAEKRTIAMNYARDNNYDAMWFVDSDVIPLDNTLNKLSKTNKDICIAPYPVPWAEYPCVGIESDKPPYIALHEINMIDKLTARKPCIIAGFGCTYVNNTAFGQKIEYKKITDNDTNLIVFGEDIGFFLNCQNAGLSCEYLTKWEQPHLYNRNK